VKHRTIASPAASCPADRRAARGPARRIDGQQVELVSLCGEPRHERPPNDDVDQHHLLDRHNPASLTFAMFAEGFPAENPESLEGDEIRRATGRQGGKQGQPRGIEDRAQADRGARHRRMAAVFSLSIGPCSARRSRRSSPKAAVISSPATYRSSSIARMSGRTLHAPKAMNTKHAQAMQT
jgi:hypothetical protein